MRAGGYASPLGTDRCSRRNDRCDERLGRSGSAERNRVRSKLAGGQDLSGVFNSGRRRPGSQGALQLRFAVNGDVFTAHFWRRLGQLAYGRAAYAITQPGQSGDARGLDYLGEVGGLTVTRSTVRYVDPTGGKVQLTYDNGRLLGRSDPRGGTEWRMTRVANVPMVCR